MLDTKRNNTISPTMTAVSSSPAGGGGGGLSTHGSLSLSISESSTTTTTVTNCCNSSTGADVASLAWTSGSSSAADSELDDLNSTISECSFYFSTPPREKRNTTSSSTIQKKKKQQLLLSRSSSVESVNTTCTATSVVIDGSSSNINTAVSTSTDRALLPSPSMEPLCVDDAIVVVQAAPAQVETLSETTTPPLQEKEQLVDQPTKKNDANDEHLSKEVPTTATTTTNAVADGWNCLDEMYGTITEFFTDNSCVCTLMVEQLAATGAGEGEGEADNAVDGDGIEVLDCSNVSAETMQKQVMASLGSEDHGNNHNNGGGGASSNSNSNNGGLPWYHAICCSNLDHVVFAPDQHPTSGAVSANSDESSSSSSTTTAPLSSISSSQHSTSTTNSSHQQRRRRRKALHNRRSQKPKCRAQRIQHLKHSMSGISSEPSSSSARPRSMTLDDALILSSDNMDHDGLYGGSGGSGDQHQSSNNKSSVSLIAQDCNCMAVLNEPIHHSMSEMGLSSLSAADDGGSDGFGVVVNDSSSGVNEALYYDSEPELSFSDELDSQDDEDKANFDAMFRIVGEPPIDETNCVDNFQHATMNLTWHMPGQAPVCVKAWIEQGSRLHSRIIQPRLVWRNAAIPKTMSKGVLPSVELNSVELLDIYRVLHCTDDKENYPFAKPTQSFVVTTSNDGLYLFEAKSVEEKEMCMNGLKNLVSRLASMIIVGDDGVFDEFFNPRGAGVPGHAPMLWAR
mmetsp:Transcript_25575/g.38188  ORF Transcript_25575/g.38188 Transcript_25575/m.38188 type:complete len:737 (-) Transcript_25575:159-2369(-)